MPFTFTAPIEEVPEPVVFTLQPPERPLKGPMSDRFRSPVAIERNWTPLIERMTTEQAVMLRQLAQSAYELDAFKPKLTRAEADRCIAMLTAKLKLLDGPPHTI
jgi:hypothetical protein